jgi:primary-amine oxidase
MVAAPTAPVHPLDALTPPEIGKAVALLRAANHLTDSDQIVSLSLVEPQKTVVKGWTVGKPFGREAQAVVLGKGQLAEARLDLSHGKIDSWTPVANRQASLTVEEILAAADIVKKDAGWREAVARRGITNFDAVACFPLSVGPVVAPALRERRLMKVPCAETTGTDNNLWGKPIDNLLATVDVTERKVVELLDLGAVPLPPETPSHKWENSDRSRLSPKPVDIIAPDGSNVVLRDGLVHWDKWSFHVAWNRGPVPCCR